jgi:SAM-dependent methyltransferase
MLDLSLMSNSTDKHWKRFGDVDPYFGVFAADRFRKDQLTTASLEEFFRSGEQHIAWVFSRIEGPFRAQRALDFGCGVGRLLPALASRAGFVVGCDISQGMLNEAQKNCTARNISFSLKVEGTFDFVHSFIVFQHIPPRSGEKILADLLPHLHGVGALHFSCASRSSWPRRAASVALDWLPFPIRGVANTLRGKPFSYPRMQFYIYDVMRLLDIFKAAGCRDIRVESVDHGDIAGCMFIFKRD